MRRLFVTLGLGLIGLVVGGLAGWGGGIAGAELLELDLDQAVLLDLISIAACAGIGLAAGVAAGLVLRPAADR